MLVRVFKCQCSSGSVPVFLNVYDVTPINGYAYWLGLGIYHSGIQVHGVEYAYGAHDHPTTGIFEVEPRQCPGFRFRRSVLLGRTDLGPREVHALVDSLATDFPGNSYHLIARNCNHFCNEASLRLTGIPIPRWVNRLANLGFFCNCVLPSGMHVATVRQKGTEEEENGKVELIEKDRKKDSTEVVGEAEKEKNNSSHRSKLGHSSSLPSSSSTINHATPSASLSTTAAAVPKWLRRGRGKFQTSSSARAALVAKA